MSNYVLEHSNEAERLEYQATIPQYSIKRELRFYRPEPSSHVLDLGCGTGILARELADNYPHLTIDACDMSDIRLAQAKKIAKTRGLQKINFFNADINDLKIKDSSYDCVFVRYVLEHLQNPISAAEQVWRILRPGGRAYVIDFDGIFINLFSENHELNEYLVQFKNNFSGDLEIGRKLPRLLHMTGFKNIDVNVDLMHFKGEEMHLEKENNRVRFVNGFNEFSRILGAKEKAQQFEALYLAESTKPQNVVCFNKYIVTAVK